ncbi:MAG TPA: DUF2332 family protein [Acidimicrobiia bacterium]|nr:DUF2332 family protein [Acidimicrobiia bacterium]
MPKSRGPREWPDQAHRLRLLRAGLDVAATMRVAVKKAEAIAWTIERWRPKPGTATVLYHSIVMQYLPG